MTDQRGDLGPKKKWEQEQEESEEEETKEEPRREEEEDMMPRKNRDLPEGKAPFVPKFVPREKSQERNRDTDYRYKKNNPDSRNNKDWDERGSKKDTAGKFERNIKDRRQGGRDGERTYDNREQRDDRNFKNNRDNRDNRYNRDNRGPRDNQDGRDNRPFNREGNNDRNDYSIEQLPRRPLPGYTNMIEIKKNDRENYISDAQKLLSKFNFITIRGVRGNIGEAFSIAEEICRLNKNLDRINIPGTDRVEEIHHPQRAGLVERRKTKYIPMVTIELSKQELNNRHIGHQTYKNTEYAEDYKRPPKRNKRQYAEKVEKANE